MKRSAPLVPALAVCAVLWFALAASAQFPLFPSAPGPHIAAPSAGSPPAGPARQSANRRLPRTLENFDLRANLRRSLDAPPEETAPSGARRLSARSASEPQSPDYALLRARPRTRLRWSSLTRTPSRVANYEEPLSEPSADDPEAVARRFLTENRDLYRLSAEEVDGLRVARRYRTEHNGLTHLVLEQHLNGIAVFQAQLAAHLDRSGALIAASGELLPDAARAVNLARPRLTVIEALRLAAGYADTEVAGPITPLTEARGAEQQQDFDRAAGFAREVPARLVYFPLSATQARLAWEFMLWMKETPDAYLLLVDAERGSLLYRYNLTVYDENPLRPHGLVYTGDSPRPGNPYTTDSPPTVERQDLPFRAAPFNGAPTFAVSDPHYDWWAGATADGLVSNNVDVHLDRDATPNQPDLPRLTAPDGNFSFPIDLTQAPTTEDNQKAAQVNLFYWINRYHDILYAFGFTEAAGNFQTNNFGLGGLGNDAIQADAQDGSGTNNANFSTPPDGRAGRVQMFLWSGSPQLDGDLDQGVIIHELTHGLSNRLVGNATGLGGAQAGGMGEGWSDYFAIALMRSESDDLDGSYGVGQYVRNNYARGIRRFPYSTSLTVNPLTYGQIALNSQVHAVGEIWCNTLLEMRALLIRQHGFREGQRQSLQLVVDGLKLTPNAPTFLDARDAILLADRVNNGGANQCLLWQAFAKRGLGYSASTNDATDTAPRESFDPPPYCNDTGSFRLDKRNYIVGETVRIALGDRNAAAPVRVQVRSSATGDQEMVTLQPDAVFAGSHNGVIRLAAGRAANDGALQASVEAGDQIIVTYDDASTASGATAQVKVTAGVVREKTFFDDDVEQGNQGWIATGSWAITRARAASPTHCWTDSPTGNYLNNSNTSLTSPLLDLTNLGDVVLTIAHSYDLETNFDFAIVEFSVDDGATWSRATAFTGQQASFTQARITLDGLANQARARVRFRLFTDQSVLGDGWYLDDIRITARSADAAVIKPGGTPVPVLAALSPAFGPPAGGTRVMITGANFTETNDTSVTFGEVPATGINVLGSSTMIVTAPPHAAGAVTVRVVNRHGAAALAGGFTYYVTGSPAGAPTLAQLFPATGSTRGGTVVTLLGANFTPETAITFGAQSAAVTFVNASTLRAVTPASATIGAVDVSARNGAASITLAGAFTYIAPTPPTVQMLSPNGGETVYAGSSITLRWRSSDNRAVTGHRIALYRSTGAQTPAFELVADIAAELSGSAQSFIWTIPTSLAATNLARIRVTAIDDEGVESEAYSSGDFTLAKRWEAVTSLPIALQRLSVASDGKYIYAIGGRTSSLSSTTVATVNRYDPVDNTWAIFAPSPAPPPLPTGLNGGEAVYLHGKIYVPGGFTAASAISASHFAFDVAANSWATLPDVPGGVYLYALAADEARGVYYLTGGNNNIGGPVAGVRAYKPASNEWSELPPMNIARYGHEATLIGGKLYVVGGFGATGGLRSGEVYDFETKQWSPIADLHRARRFAAGAVGQDPAGNPLWFVAGGEDPSTSAPLGSAEVYDVRLNRWVALDNSFNLITPRTHLGGAVLDGMFYTVGGAMPTSNVSTVSSPANERLRLSNLSPVSLDQPPVLAVPAAQVAVAGAELQFSVIANDLGSGIPLTITAEGLPADASFTTTVVTNNSARGRFRWTPAAGDAGQIFTLAFTASDGQLSETKSVTVRVAEASPLAVVNAAHYRFGALPPDSIATAFGSNLAVRTEAAQTLPLPLTLAGTTVTINGVAAPLLFVSPTQINFAIPPHLEPGAATIIVSNALGSFALGAAEIAAANPALFTADASGAGDAAAVATADGVNYQLAPFDITVNGQPNILSLFGTGFRHAPAANPNDGDGVAEAVSATVDGRAARVLYAGAQGQFVGLDQLNIELPQSLAAAGPGLRRVEVVVTLHGVAANRVTILLK
jgi:uncharacterized protein (TIGR03437 family)